MRICGIPVNAELLEIVIPIDDPVYTIDTYNDWQSLIDLVHSIVINEAMAKITGALPNPVRNRPGHSYKLGDFY